MPREGVIFADDLQAIPGNGTSSPAEGKKSHSKRKQTLLSLLDALHELSKDDELALLAANQQPSFEDDRDVPTVDEHLQKVGAEAFNSFERRITNLDTQLRNFANAARRLGSSVGILSSVFYLRERLTQILFLFRENASDIFPRKVAKPSRESMMSPKLRDRRKNRRKGPVHLMNPALLEELDLEAFPDQFEKFAEDVTTFLDCLNEFPEFTDEGVNTSIMSLEGDLKYWASCLRVYEGQFRYPAVQRYVHDLSGEMGEHLDSITSALQMFIEIGVPTIRFAQEHAANNLLNLSTVATFFSAVTATTMQFSFDQVGTPLADAVNGFWFTSLVFSIAAAVNSLLGLTWKKAIYRSPGDRVPWWVLIWIKRSPLVFLVLSVACFSIGLVLFAYSSGQHYITSTVTTVFSAFSSFGLAAVSTWFISERLIFNRHKGAKWLADALSDTRVRLYSAPGIAWIVQQPRAAARRASYWAKRKSRDASDIITEVSKKTLSVLRVGSIRSASSSSDSGDTEAPLPTSLSPEPMSPGSMFHRFSETGLSPISEVASTRGRSLDGTEEKTVSDAPSTNLTTSTGAKTRWKNAVRAISMVRPFSVQASNSPRSPARQRTLSSEGRHSSRLSEPIVKISRVANLVPRLKSLQTTQDLAAHQALVRHLQFSPDGQYLATSSWDRTSVIFRVGDPFTSHRILAHPQGFVGQVAWSPTGKFLLTKLNRGIKVWTAEEGVCRRTIDRKRAVQSIAWLPGGEAFLSVEDAAVTKLDLNGNILDQYKFERLSVHDVAVTQDSRRMLCVASLTESPNQLQPSKSRAEKQIIVYNLDRKEIENRVPVLHDVRDITLARNDQVALAPPQLWKMEPVKDSVRLSLRHTYMPKVQVDFAGPSYFGGKNDQLILCAGKGGDIHIWDRESAALLHHIRAQSLGGDLTCIAWNHAHDSFMFATGSHDGGVRIWTTPPGEEPSLAPSRATTNPTSTPRTPSPSPFDADYRTESPNSAVETPGAQSSDQQLELSEPYLSRRVTFT
ncbi:WD40 repeat-like protein [Panus rudis PR-1116 ss-1]|nr:WD40 repeat-like protein [Panus rudis PR-1116 ss-1]